MTTLPQAHPLIGSRVRIPTSPTGPQKGVGSAGVVVSARELSSDVTGVPLRWVSVDVRLDSGALVTYQPHQLSVIRSAD